MHRNVENMHPYTSLRANFKGMNVSLVKWTLVIATVFVPLDFAVKKNLALERIPT